MQYLNTKTILYHNKTFNCNQNKQNHGRDAIYRV